MLSVDHLRELKPPWVALYVSGSDAELLVPGLTVRTLDAQRMRSTSTLFVEFAAQLDFPDYFGSNWDAFEECLADLSWLSPRPDTIVIGHASELLAEESPGELAIFLRLIEKVAAEWASPISRGEGWDRSAVPFHLVFEESPEHRDVLRSRIRIAGREVDELRVDSDPLTP